MYSNRQEAGHALARALEKYTGNDTVVLGLPRGGVVVAAEVAKKLGAKLGVLLVRKIGHPYSSEFALGAMAEDDAPVYDLVEAETIDPTWLKLEEEAAREMIDHRRELYYDAERLPIDLQNKTVILVDDGMATGLTMLAAVEAARHRGASRVVVAVPVASRSSVADINGEADEIIVLDNPGMFQGAVGAHYRQFDRVDDIRVRQILHMRPSFL